MKQFFDERQTQTAEHLGTISFYVIFLVSITAILIQLTFFSAPLQNVIQYYIFYVFLLYLLQKF